MARRRYICLTGFESGNPLVSERPSIHPPPNIPSTHSLLTSLSPHSSSCSSFKEQLNLNAAKDLWKKFVLVTENITGCHPSRSKRIPSLVRTFILFSVFCSVLTLHWIVELYPPNRTASDLERLRVQMRALKLQKEQDKIKAASVAQPVNVDPPSSVAPKTDIVHPQMVSAATWSVITQPFPDSSAQASPSPPKKKSWLKQMLSSWKKSNDLCPYL